MRLNATLLSAPGPAEEGEGSSEGKEEISAHLEAIDAAFEEELMVLREIYADGFTSNIERTARGAVVHKVGRLVCGGEEG
ncbi:MAG: hypothetical protein SGPRY_010112 [Prymnesium sp.]